jgi:hypothetical protein
LLTDFGRKIADKKYLDQTTVLEIRKERAKRG